MSFFEIYPQLQALHHLAKRRRNKVYLVGGFWRDYLLKRSCFDFDFAVDKNAIALAKSFAKAFRGAFVLLDEEHGCARVVKKIEGQIWTFDFADFRGATIKKDLAHRDFFINVFSVNLNALVDQETVDQLLRKQLISFRDLKFRRIRMVSPIAFKEDPLRLLRAYSLQAVLDFKIESKTKAQIKKDRDLIRQVSAERIREEVFKILESPRAAAGLKALDEIGLLEKVMPQIAIMQNVSQGGYHHLDVWPHSLETVVQLEGVLKEFENDVEVKAYAQEEAGGGHSRRSVMKLAALLHDIGKPETRKQEGERMSFHGHEHVGRGIVRQIARFLKISTKERMMLEDMVLWHLRPGYLANFKRPTDKAFFRYFRDAKEEGASIALLAMADQRSTRGPLTTPEDEKHHEKICREVVDRFFEKKKEKPFVRLINGNDLIKELKLKPSPLFAQILKTVEEEQSLGKVATKEEALNLAKKVVQG
ncbi:MAG: HD domain-containing protein [Candidatus Omnitrophica bacterium]|nr:HD domain-containing protein [Candidatus Omnitrophota bacterium]